MTVSAPPSPAPSSMTRSSPARAPWLHTVKAGQTLRIVDLEGNQAVDFLAYSAADDAERYSAQDTIAAQGNVFLREGSVLLSNEGAPMMTVTATAVAYHDTIGGACSCESNTLRYGHHTKAQHACVENFLTANARHGRGKRDMVSNVNWFMNVPVEADGALGIVDGISAPASMSTCGPRWTWWWWCPTARRSTTPATASIRRPCA
jgi:urea carboxylase-associated protein 1